MYPQINGEQIMKLRNKILLGILIFLFLTISSLALALSYTSDCEPSSALSENTKLMKSVSYRCYGAPDVLEYKDSAKPYIGDDEILVKVYAAAVNPLDWHYMRGTPYLMRLMSGLGAPKHTGIGRDFSGIVESVGTNITKFKAGDEVFGGASAAFAEYITIREEHALVLKPSNMTFQQAASVPVAGITALQALRDKGNVQAGQKVLINGASGGVGTFAVQIAKSFGAEVTGVCSTRNLDMVRSLGADYVIDYKKEDYTTNGVQYDLIIDMIGNHSLLENRKSLTPEGTMVMIGQEKGNWIAPLKGPVSALIISPFVDQKFVMFIAQLKKDDLETLGNLMQEGKVTPVIKKRYPLSEVAEAIRFSEKGHAQGKIIIEMK